MKDVLLVDDESAFLSSLSDGLKAYFPDIKIITAGNGKKAVEILGVVVVDMVITDLKMPVMDGFELVEHMKKNQPAIPIAVMTAFNVPTTWHRLKKMGVKHMIEKPVDFHHMTAIIERMEKEGIPS